MNVDYKKADILGSLRKGSTITTYPYGFKKRDTTLTTLGNMNGHSITTYNAPQASGWNGSDCKLLSIIKTIVSNC